jgi:hypothetical protein
MKRDVLTPCTKLAIDERQLLFTSRLIVTCQCSMSALAIWHSSRLNNCLTRVTKEKKASDKGIRQNL